MPYVRKGIYCTVHPFFFFTPQGRLFYLGPITITVTQRLSGSKGLQDPGEACNTQLINKFNAAAIGLIYTIRYSVSRRQ